MNRLHKVNYASPIGVVEIIGTDESIFSIMFTEQDKPLDLINDHTTKVLIDCYTQLDEYFQGKRHEFTFPYIFEGTEFQKNVWSALLKIPYAEIGNYKEIAASIANEKAVRAVGNANGKNKLSIVIPCHRIIGSNGKLTGYAGGLWRKEWLLQHERTFKK